MSGSITADQMIVLQDRQHLLRDHDRTVMSATGGMKESIGKPPISLVPAELIYGAARAFEFGAKKYSPHNWRKGIPRCELYNALQRHLADYNEGVDRAGDSNLLHLDHAAACLAMLMQTCKDNLSPDDRHNAAEVAQQAGVVNE